MILPWRRGCCAGGWEPGSRASCAPPPSGPLSWTRTRGPASPPSSPPSCRGRRAACRRSKGCYLFKYIVCVCELTFHQATSLRQLTLLLTHCLSVRIHWYMTAPGWLRTPGSKGSLELPCSSSELNEKKGLDVENWSSVVNKFVGI